MVDIKTWGCTDRALRFFTENGLKDPLLWKKIVDVFRTMPDSENRGWSGEFWGKMMRGASLVYAVTKEEELYQILTESVEDLLTVADTDGRVSSYRRDKEFFAWDLWCRKYVILGCEYYLEICKKEELKKEIVSFISKCADYILEHVGSGEGKIEITDSSKSWRGLNSATILEPMVKLYRLTGEKKYLDFSTYVVKSGGAKEINVLKLAYENKKLPYQYGVSKAYEMMSLFEGLLEYYYVTGIEECKAAVINFAEAVMESEISVIGGSGVTNELFDFTSARQTVRTEDVSQETCVTVTWMKLCASLLSLTGDSHYADCMERSFYNAYLGSLNTEGKISSYMRKRYIEELGMERICDTVLPVDSYSPLVSKKRGECVGGNQLFSDLSYYGCCAAISSAGIGVFMREMITIDQKGITINFFEEGTSVLQYEDALVKIHVKTEYPIDGKIMIAIETSLPKEFELKVRVPGWTGEKAGYAVYKKEWSKDTVEINFSMKIRFELPKTWEKETVYIPKESIVYHDPDDDNYIALLRGPITLAADSRMGKRADSVFSFASVWEVCSEKTIVKDTPCLLKIRFEDEKGEPFYLVDYSSAGKDWETEIAAWLRTQ